MILVENKGLSERRAAKLVRVSRTVLPYQKQRGDDKVIRAALRRLADKKRAYGYRMLWRKLRQQGHLVNHKRVYRSYPVSELLIFHGCHTPKTPGSPL